MKRRFNLLVLALEIAAIAMLHAVKINDNPKSNDQSVIAHFTNSLGRYKVQAAKLELPEIKSARITQ